MCHDYLLAVSKKRPIIDRGGFNLHIDFRPIKVRIKHGKPYANVLDDCFECVYHLDEDIFNDNYERVAIHCIGDTNIKSLNDIKKAIIMPAE